MNNPSEKQTNFLILFTSLLEHAGDMSYQAQNRGIKVYNESIVYSFDKVVFARSVGASVDGMNLTFVKPSYEILDDMKKLSDMCRKYGVHVTTRIVKSADWHGTNFVTFTVWEK